MQGKKSKRLAVYGGTFDPPHEGHSLVIDYLLNNFDKVIIEPVGNHDFGKQLTSDEDRLVMLNLILPNLVEIDLFEINKTRKNPKAISYSFETLLYLQKKYPDYELVLIIGADNLTRFHQWDDHNGESFEKMLEKFKVSVYPRKNFENQPLYKNMEVIQNVEELAVSSTNIREKIKNGEEIKGLVDNKVLEYIKNNKLYLT